MAEAKKILIVDDDTDVRELVHLVLEHEGYKVMDACSGKEGVEVAAKEHPSLILMDIGLPEMDGYEATKQIKSEAEMAKVPVIFLTGKSEEEDAGRSFASGAISYICKPFTNQQLKDVVMLVLLSLGAGDSLG